MRQKVACVILNYNDYDNTTELVKSIEHYDVLDHVIVVDNASTDGSAEILKSLRSSKVSVWITPHNGGYGAGNNYGIRIAKNTFDCDYAFIVNPDVRFEESTATSVLECFAKHPHCIAATAIQHGKENQTVWNIPTLTYFILSFF